VPGFSLLMSPKRLPHFAQESLILRRINGRKRSTRAATTIGRPNGQPRRSKWT